VPTRAPADARRSVCSNRAATQVNILKSCENNLTRNAAVCRNLAISRNVRKNVALLLQGGGRWFELSIAHCRKVVIYREYGGMV
jgi:hypothetical protein